MIFLEDADFTLHQGDALQVLQGLPDESVHMCVTSPPFYGLRDYGTGAWEGGDEGCDHAVGMDRQDAGRSSETFNGGHHASVRYAGRVCGKCGARRTDQQIGLEATPDEWVARLVEVFREVRRVLRRDGTLWLEIGDSYAQGRGHGTWADKGQKGNERGQMMKQQWRHKGAHDIGLKPKDLIGAPWLLAFALRADGWYLRSDIVWARPNPMPESVRDRPTKSHSYVFLLSKQPRYFMDMEAVREPLDVALHAPGNNKLDSSRNDHDRMSTVWGSPAGRNLRSVWTIPTEPLPDEHYAAYPQKLVERCILAGTSERGVCPECGAPWERVVAQTPITTPTYTDPRGYSVDGGARDTITRFGDGVTTKTTGWQPTCTCHQLEPVPATVLDCFLGSGTTALVSRRLGRRCVGIELSETYVAMAARRTRQLSLLG